MKLTKTIIACLLLLGVSPAWGAMITVPTPYGDSIPIAPETYDINDDASGIAYGGGEYGFYYQLRDVSSSGDDSGHTLAGPQWFATTYENYLYNIIHANDTVRLAHSLYRRTLGGEMVDPAGSLYQDQDVPMVVLADLLHGVGGTRNFDYVYIDEPQPYREWLAYYAQHYGLDIDALTYYDPYVNPMESLCLVFPEGSGTLNMGFVNHYANHFPYWPDLNDANNFNIQEEVRLEFEDKAAYTAQVIPGGVQTVPASASADVRVSVTASNPRNYGSALGYLALRQSAAQAPNAIGWRESILIPTVVANVHDGPASDAGNELYFDLSLRDPSLSSGDINAIVDRVKFRWGASGNATKRLGNFFVMQPYNSAGDMPTYAMETRVTNRTGVRYRLQRYDEIEGNVPNEPGGTGNTETRRYFRDIVPSYWAYDLPADRYGTLPSSFRLDNHSQIAPGLVTVFEPRTATDSSGRPINDYGHFHTDFSTDELFRLYTFSGSVPNDLTLRYTRVAGMTLGSSAWQAAVASRSFVRPFSMQFVDVFTDDNTDRQLQALLGKEPVSVDAAHIPSLELQPVYLDKDYLNAFELTAEVPEAILDASRDQAALLPVVVRFCIPRDEQFLALPLGGNSSMTRWEALEAASGEKLEATGANGNRKAMLDVFKQFGSIWLRSSSAWELDANLLTALDTRSRERVSAGQSEFANISDTVRIFTYNDRLYLEFMAILADASSTRTGKTAFIELFEDDDIPYILIGDGETDKQWKMTFFIADQGTSRADNPEDPTPRTSGGGGGGGCDLGWWGAGALLVGLCLHFLKDKNRGGM